MTRQDYMIIARCIAECHNENYDLEDTIGFYSNMLRQYAGKFNPDKFKSFILERTKPDHIPKEQAKEWAIKKAKK